MKKTMFLLVACATLVLCAGTWTTDFEAAKKTSKEKNLPMMLDFTGSDWCLWCKLMDKKVFAEKEWDVWAATNVVCVTVDFPSDRSAVSKKNEELLEKYGVRGFPTFVLLAPGGVKELGRAHCPGRDVTPAAFIAEVKKAIGKGVAAAK